MKLKDKLTLRFELTNLQARFALLAEHNRQALIVLGEMRNIVPLQREQIEALTEENARLKEVLNSLGLPGTLRLPTSQTLTFVENDNDKEGRIVTSEDERT